MEWVEGNTHSFLFPQNLKFSFPPKLGGIGGNEIRFNDFFTKTPKIPLYIQLSIYIYKTEAFEAPTIFHVSIIFK